MKALTILQPFASAFNAEGFPLVFEAGGICICAECASMIAARVAHLRPVTVWQGAIECEACKEMVQAVPPEK